MRDGPACRSAPRSVQAEPLAELADDLVVPHHPHPDVAVVLLETARLAQAGPLRPQADGGVLITDGPYLETKEHIGGFWILETADMDQAVAWARKGVVATRGQVEVREIFFSPSPD